MDWKLMASTSGLVFLAELGDETRLATMSLSAAALVLTSALAVLVGGAIARAVPEIWIHRVAGVGFIVMGVLFLAGKG
jgi:Ca2+/H+ antiporter, TMEM165/GDT1 family